MGPPSTIPETEVAKAERFCAARVPDAARHQVRLELEVDGTTLTIVERRAPYSAEVGPDWSHNARAWIRWDPGTRRFLLYRRDRHDHWRRYDGLEPQRHLDPVLAEIHEDPACIFWG